MALGQEGLHWVELRCKIGGFGHHFLERSDLLGSRKVPCKTFLFSLCIKRNRFPLVFYFMVIPIVEVCNKFSGSCKNDSQASQHILNIRVSLKGLNLGPVVVGGCDPATELKGHENMSTTVLMVWLCR